jgi:hypothetical protein
MTLFQAMSLLVTKGVFAKPSTKTSVPSSTESADEKMAEAPEQKPVVMPRAVALVDTDSEQGTGTWDPPPEVFLSRWVARVSPSGSRRASETSSPADEADLSDSTCGAGSSVELVDDCGFEWGHASSGSSCDGTTGSAPDVLDLLAILRAGPRHGRGDWAPPAASLGGSFCPELELLF